MLCHARKKIKVLIISLFHVNSRNNYALQLIN